MGTKQPSYRDVRFQYSQPVTKYSKHTHNYIKNFNDSDVKWNMYITALGTNKQQ